jgi:CheY-like chemotaxis protein
MRKHYQILVVDDDREDQLMLAEYFQECGIEDTVYFTENGQKALDYLEAITDDDQLPGLVILDLNMPIMNGTQTLIHIKQTLRFRHIPVIIFSTSENETERRKCMSSGAIEYMVKPLTFEEGRAMVKQFASFANVNKNQQP